MNEAQNKKMPIFAERFRELRGEQTQAEFADFLGISRPTVGFYENGDRVPDAIILKQIAEKCGVTSDYLLGLADNKTAGNADIGAETGLSDAAISVLKMALEQKKCLKKYNDYSGLYWSDALSVLIENLNYFPDLPHLFVQMFRLKFDHNQSDIEDTILEKDIDMYRLIYNNGIVLAGRSYKQYLIHAMQSEFKDLISYISLKINPDDYEREWNKSQTKYREIRTIEKDIKKEIEYWESENHTDAGDLYAGNSKEE